MKTAIVVLAVLCCRPESAADPTPAPPPPEVRFERDMMVRYHMHESFDLARAIERLLLVGKLGEGRDLARTIAEAPDLPDARAWARETQAVRDRAAALASAPSIDEALRREARLAGACASCHLETKIQPELRGAPSIPPDRDTLKARMARHRWAADRLWEGVIAADDETWRSGIDVLAAAPQAWPELDADRKTLAVGLQRIARTAQQRAGTDKLDDRVQLYGELLVTCAACHTASSKPR